jgi:uracil-DNA glycosylase
VRLNNIQNTIKEPSWLELEQELEKPYMSFLLSYLDSEIEEGKEIFPAREDWFRALEALALPDISVVIVGQDPYPTPGHAHGLSFSVQPGVGIPRSLRNIYKEMLDDLGVEMPDHGYLMPWAEQGCLLLNDTLTVESGAAGSHQKKGWSQFTDKALELVASENKNVVFILWGRHAQKKGEFIDRDRHLVIESVHPSPLSARRGFFGSRPFSKANEYLIENGRDPIDWSL